MQRVAAATAVRHRRWTGLSRSTAPVRYAQRLYRRSLCLLRPMQPLPRVHHCQESHPWARLRPLSVRLISASARSDDTVDLRSDTVTVPSEAMLRSAMDAPLGDDVMGEDPTVRALENRLADMFGKEGGLFVPTGTMSNLVALMAHCNTRASEVIAGRASHVCLWEGGNAANLAGVSVCQVAEDASTAQMDPQDVRSSIKTDDDDHWPHTQLLCLENTHNMLGGVPLSKQYMDDMGNLARALRIRVHVDGARIFHSVVALQTTPDDLCASVDSVSVCLSKGLGAPVGSVLVGDTDFLRLARRARKRCGGGMRQAGVIAAMGIHALDNNVDRLQDDHQRAKYLADELRKQDFRVQDAVETNIVYFALPQRSNASMEQFSARLKDDYGVLLTGGYSKSGNMFRAVTHMGVSDTGIAKAVDAVVQSAV